MISIIKHHGLKNTPTREAILELLIQVHKPIDVPLILSYLQKKNIPTDRATVFRNMNIFTDLGITRRVELNDGRSRYELASRPHHHHAVCMKCKTIIDVPECNMPVIERTLARKLQFTVTAHTIELYGTCAACS